MKIGILGLLFLGVTQICSAQFSLRSGQSVTVACDNTEEKVVQTALQLFARDYETVFSAPATISVNHGGIIVGTVDKSPLIAATGVDISDLKSKNQAFLISVLPGGRLLVAGSDSPGTAYGIMELSRLIGVSPWEWWADVTPEKKEAFHLAADYKMVQSPSVEYRGIFINDEDWGLMPWSSLNYEPWYKPGRIGPQTNERIFELLLRLRANTYWPAMHECSVPFFLTPGNREAAEKFGIYIGGSHCEPMACSTAGEWSRRGKGDYDYVKNSSSVCHFWEERLKEVSGQEILYTVGMRGVHDGQMQGAKTVEEQKAVLERVLKDQRELLRKYVNKDVEAIPQVFIPYKEVLDIYRAGLEVPEDVTLMWCDDNYGYIKHFPTEVERTRKGGNGVYYHVSYWGRPHDYLWLGTFSPALLYQQMKEAYDRGIQKIWILNVGDIKPIEYQTELFLDMAWNIDQVIEEGVSGHLCNFLKREFGEAIGEDLLPVMMEHYRLSYIRKPEFMGNTREEEYHTNAYRIVKDMPWSRSYIKKRLEDYQVISDKVEKLASRIQQDRQDAYFQLIKYPVQATAEMNKKMLYAQFARHGEMNWNKSDAAYDSIASLTRIYNIGIRNNGKWHRMMDHQPRRLPVFEPVDRSSVETPMLEDSPGLYKWNGAEYSAGDAVSCEGLGYEEKAVMLEKNKELSFDFGECPGDSVEVEIRLLPNHPIHGGQLRFSVSIDKKNAQTVSYETQGRSEEWKENVLRNQAIRRVVLPVKKRKNHNLTIKALDEGVVIDQIEMYQLN
ncbi:glycosyl hydrolase 115 family protein [Bacteroides cellulosilyticus]|uniref:glycosyl hydrolase 115 family protein n=1 Tax=Bacteroides cellulosilyticus TaxID=246787 RepID=UPI00189E4E02|nr:glycosyl hydrolase 115 family protein [Bacteroides cellulosilyticus]